MKSVSNDVRKTILPAEVSLLPGDHRLNWLDSHGRCLHSNCYFDF
jgi:hypothetical protein